MDCDCKETVGPFVYSVYGDKTGSVYKLVLHRMDTHTLQGPCTLQYYNDLFLTCITWTGWLFNCTEQTNGNIIKKSCLLFSTWNIHS